MTYQRSDNFPKTDRFYVEGMEGFFRIIGVKKPARLAYEASEDSFCIYDSLSANDPSAEGWTVQYQGWYFYNGILRSVEEVIGFCEFAANMYKQGHRDMQQKFRIMIGCKGG